MVHPDVNASESNFSFQRPPGHALGGVVSQIDLVVTLAFIMEFLSVGMFRPFPVRSPPPF